jgi:Tol biopolymer transport system component
MTTLQAYSFSVARALVFLNLLGLGQSVGATSFTQLTNSTSGDNTLPSISADGSRVAFLSTINSGNPEYDLFLWTEGGGTTQLTSNGAVNQLALSRDGVHIAITATGDLAPGAPGNADGRLELFLWIEGVGITQLTKRVNITFGTATISPPSISADGRRIAFVSSHDLATGALNPQLYVWTEGAGVQPLARAYSAAMNAAGTRIAFVSNASFPLQVFLWTEGVGFSQLTGTSSWNGTDDASISINSLGTRIVFTANGDLTPGAPGNADGNQEVFLWTESAGITQLTNTSGSSAAGGPIFGGFRPSISGDGNVVAFTSNADLTPGAPGNSDGSFEVFVWTEGVGFTQLTSTISSVSWSISADGRRVALSSNGDLSPGAPGNSDGNPEVFVASVELPPATAAVLAVSPSALDFSGVNVGSSKDLSFTVQNTGGGTLTGSASTSAPFSIVGANSFNLAANQSTDITVRFSPTSEATFNGNANFTSNGGSISPTVMGIGIVLPHIDSLSAVSGAVGSPLLINGLNFGASQGTGSLNFCSTALEVSHWENSLIAVLVPQVAAGNVCAVQVSTSAGLSNSLNFTVSNAATISGFLKTSANKAIKGAQVFTTAGTAGSVTSNLKGFYSKSGLVNGQYTVEPRLSGYQFTPEQQVVTRNGTSLTNVNFIGAPVLPVLKKLTSKTTTGNVTVTITGSGFGSATSEVMFGSVRGDVTSWKNTKIVAVAPPGTGCVLVTVVTATGTSNSKSFNCSSAPGAANVMILPSGDFGVLIFTQLQTISSDSTNVVADITILNNTGAWYVVHPNIVGNISGSSLPSGDFIIGPREEKSLGTITFQKGSRLSLFADNTIDLGSCAPICNLQTRRILGAMAVELFWRVVTGSEYPVEDSDKILFLAELEIDNPVVNLGVDIFQLDLLGIVNDLPDLLNDPVIEALLAAHGIPSDLAGWLTLYGRAALEARLLLETLIYPHFGELAFDAK